MWKRNKEVEHIPEGFRCPFCSSTQGYIRKVRVHPVGWILFVLLGIFPFGLLGLLIKERWQVCQHCKMKLG